MWKVQLTSKLVHSDYLLLTARLVSDLGMRLYLDGLPDELFVQHAKKLNFAFPDGGNIVCGQAGSVGTLLGENHAYSSEQRVGAASGRPVPYIAAYVARRGAEVPGLAALEAAVREDVQTILERAHRGHRSTVLDRHFDVEADKRKIWDAAARDVSQGRRAQLTLFADERRVQPLCIGTRSPYASDAEKREIFGAGAASRGRGRNEIAPTEKPTLRWKSLPQCVWNEITHTFEKIGAQFKGSADVSEEIIRMALDRVPPHEIAAATRCDVQYVEAVIEKWLHKRVPK